MSVIGSNILAGASGQGGAYTISRSVRMRSSAGGYFSRTPATTTNRQTWTFSCWIKQSVGNSFRSIFGSGTTSAAGNYGTFAITASNQLDLEVWAGAVFTTNAVFRDPSAWYHIVLAVDTTQATSSNRVKLYVNGVQILSFAVDSVSSYYTLNYDTAFNQAQQTTIGSLEPYAGLYLDAYITETNWIDGQQLTPSSFGETNAITGVWQPKKYSGTYGTNGFYLNFSDNSAATATTIGKDYSGNGNNWTPNNINVTAYSGTPPNNVSYDSMVDSPTVGATSSNYAVLNPLYVVPSSTMPTFSNGNLKQTQVGGEGVNTCVSVASMPFPTSGKWYCEVTFVTAATSSPFRTRFGIQADAQINNSLSQNTGKTQCFDYSANGNKGNNNAETAYGNTYTSGDTIGMAVDLDNGKIWWSKNGTFQASGDPAAGTNAAYTTLVGSNNYFTSVGWFATSDINFGQRPFSTTPPTGFVALNTQNLPTPTISNGASYMAATTYTGTGVTGRAVSNAVNGTSMQPDLVWVKSRSSATYNELYDSVRGVSLRLFSNDTAAEADFSPYGVTAFSSGGFTVSDITSGGYGVNENAVSYIGWQWNAGGSTVTNTSGSISAQVRANPTAGFSVVTYTGTGAAATVGHGLGVAPSMIIWKGVNYAINWAVYHVSTGVGAKMYLDLTNASAADTTYMNNTAPTSSVFSIAASSWTNNTSSSTYVAYCFAAVAGYSAFGSYTGNGSTDGPFVYCGFRPRFVLFKKSSAADDWIIYDTSRNTYNVASNNLYPNGSYAEDTNTTNRAADILSNGFKIRSSATFLNLNAATFIYMAFAENPFKYSLAR